MDPLVPQIYLSTILANITSITFIRLGIIIACILISAFFAASETAISSCNRFKLQALEETGDRRAKIVLKIIEKFDDSIISILIWINVAHIIPTTLATVLLVDLIGNETIASLLSTIVMTLLIFFFSETLPKIVANRNSDKLALSFAYPLYSCIIILKPLSLFFQGFVWCVKKIFKINDNLNVMTEDDFQDTIEDIQEEGKLDEDESELIQNAVDFGDFTVRDVMTPIEKTVLYDVKKGSRREILNFLKGIPYSRIPVYEDEVNNIVGILHVKKYLFKAYTSNNYFNFKAILNKPLFINHTTKIDDMIEIFQQNLTHIAIIQDDLKNVVGMVTMEDVVEKLVGDIDEKNPPKVFKGGKK